jgi:glycine oxidase
VRAGAETLHAPVVINASGAWAGMLGGRSAAAAGGAGARPDRGLRHVAAAAAPRGVERARLPGARGDGRVLAGSTVEKAGFDKSVTAAGVRAILDMALQIVPALADVRIADAWAGLRPGTPDGLPVIGDGALPGLVHAAGLFRDGILLGPLVGELAAELAGGATPAADLRAFSPRRFAPVAPCDRPHGRARVRAVSSLQTAAGVQSTSFRIRS